MLKGFTAPRTPAGRSSLAPRPPWHYVSNALAVEFDADLANVASFLPDGLEPDSPRCAVYFADWQFATDARDEYLDPITSQYKETIFLISARYEGEPVAYCPFIWVDQDVSLMRGLVQGWPKQIGSIWVTRAYELVSPASPTLGPGGRFGASLAVKDRRLVDATITLRSRTETPPSPGFARALNVRYFPDLAAGRHDEPSVYELVQLKSRDAQFSSIWKGDATLTFHNHPTIELSALRPTRVVGGYRFSFAFTVDDIVHLRDLRAGAHAEPIAQSAPVR
jgi:acetoacetate decarboxylase